MFIILITISCLLTQTFARPQASQLPSAQSGSTPIAIINQNEEINPDGSFKFSYETANGIKVEENGYLKDGSEPSSTDRILVIEGSVSYTDNEGKVVSLRYVADENGFQPEGDHLPTVPSVPSVAAQGRSLSATQKSESVPAAPAPTIASTQSDVQTTVS